MLYKWMTSLKLYSRMAFSNQCAYNDPRSTCICMWSKGVCWQNDLDQRQSNLWVRTQGLVYFGEITKLGIPRDSIKVEDEVPKSYYTLFTLPGWRLILVELLSWSFLAKTGGNFWLQKFSTCSFIGCCSRQTYSMCQATLPWQNQGGRICTQKLVYPFYITLVKSPSWSFLLLASSLSTKCLVL